MKKAQSRLRQSKIVYQTTKCTKTALFTITPSFLLLAFTSGFLGVFIAQLLSKQTIVKIYEPFEVIRIVEKPVFVGFKPRNKIEEMICNPDYEWDCHIMSAIAMAESGQNCLADNTGTNRDGSTDFGLMQINNIHSFDYNQIYDCEYNVKIAYRIWKEQGYNGWVAFSKHSFARYL